MGLSRIRDRRHEEREQFIGDIVWAYASTKDEDNFFEGAFVDESKSGLSILTLKPIKEGRLLKVYCTGRWVGPKHVTVKWCREIEPAVYRSGLIKTDI
jgi:phage terminase large subunit-like protein